MTGRFNPNATDRQHWGRQKHAHPRRQGVLDDIWGDMLLFHHTTWRIMLRLTPSRMKSRSFANLMMVWGRKSLVKVSWVFFFMFPASTIPPDTKSRFPSRWGSSGRRGFLPRAPPHTLTHTPTHLGAPSSPCRPWASVPAAVRMDQRQPGGHSAALLLG